MEEIEQGNQKRQRWVVEVRRIIHFSGDFERELSEGEKGRIRGKETCGWNVDGVEWRKESETLRNIEEK